MSSSNLKSDAGVRAVIGLAALPGAFVLIWFNAGTRLICERALPASAESPVKCEVGTWGFNRIALSTKVMQNVRSIERIEGRHGSGSDSVAVFSFVFVTDHGRVSPGYFADLFASEPADHALLAEFFADQARPDAVIEWHLLNATVARKKRSGFREIGAICECHPGIRCASSGLPVTLGVSFRLK